MLNKVSRIGTKRLLYQLTSNTYKQTHVKLQIVTLKTCTNYTYIIIILWKFIVEYCLQRKKISHIPRFLSVFRDLFYLLLD